MSRVVRSEELRGKGSRGGLIDRSGVLLASASWGRTSLKSTLQTLKRRCCALRLAAGGIVVSALRSLCMRSCRPFCWGEAGSMRSGVIPSLIHQTERRDRRPRDMEAKGGPLSVRMRSGSPNSWKRRVNTRRLPV